MKLGQWISLIKLRMTSGVRKSKDSATLGVMPDYGFKGKGMRIDSISVGKTAEKYELNAGDIVIQIDSQSVEDLISYMSVMAKYHVGDHAKVLVRRGQVEVCLQVEFI